MKLISARQAWHDAYYQGTSSLTQSAIEIAQLGHMVQKSARANSNATAMHQATAGRIQHAIASLTPSLRALGNFLYHPTPTMIDHQLAHAAVWFAAADKLPEAKRKETLQKCYFMAQANLRSHQAAVLDRGPWTPAAICGWMNDTYQLRMTEHNWARDWQKVWDIIALAVDKLDAAALAPVSEAVYSEYQDTIRPIERAQGKVAELLNGGSSVGGVAGLLLLDVIDGKAGDRHLDRGVQMLRAQSLNTEDKQIQREIDALEALQALDRQARRKVLVLPQKAAKLDN